MKIYTIPINKILQPASQPFTYPKHNDDYGVEQDFFEFIKQHPEFSTNNPLAADFHYLPVFWTRWHLNNNYAKTGLDVLQHEIDNVILNDCKTFIICQYDDGPLCNLGNSIQFLSSRAGNSGIDIPLLSSKHNKPFFLPKKRYKASFAGRLSTHSMRVEMEKSLVTRNDVFIGDVDRGPGFFVRNLLGSYIALCPRGYGGSSYRFYEAMQLGVLPLMISDIDTRPFKQFIKWSDISMYIQSVCDINDILDSVSLDDALHRGKLCAVTWQEKLTFQKWCSFVLKELEYLK